MKDVDLHETKSKLNAYDNLHKRDDKYDPEYWLKAMERLGDCTGALKNKGNIGLTEWCVGCLQVFSKKLISEFANDIQSDMSIIQMLQKWRKKLHD